MPENRKKDWSFRKKVYLIAGSIIIILAVHLSMKYLFRLAAPFLIAYVIALLIEKPVQLLAKRLGGRTVLAASIIVVLGTVILVGGLIYLCSIGFDEIRAFLANFDYLCIMLRQKTAWMCFNIDGMFGLTDGSSLDFLCRCADGIKGVFAGESGAKMMGSVVRLSLPIVGGLVFVFGAFIVCLISVVYLTNALDKVRVWRQNSIFREEICAVTIELKRLFNVYFKLELLIMVINAVICTAGLLVIKNPYAIVIGVLIGIIDALPFFGTGTILIPWSLISLLFKNFFTAAVLLSVYVVTYFVREIMESKCMGERLGIAPFTMLVVIFSGILLYGIFGFFLGPVAYCVIKALVRYFTSVLENAG